MAAEIIKGITELTKAFGNLSKEMQKSTAPRMVVAGGRVLRKEAKAIAQSKGLRKTGALISNIAIKREKSAPAGTSQYNLGVRHGRDLGKRAKKYVAVGKSGRIVVKYKNDPFYWRFLERGRNIYKGVANSAKLSRRTKDSYATGRVEATPFIAPALQNKRTEAIAAMETELQKQIDKSKA